MCTRTSLFAVVICLALFAAPILARAQALYVEGEVIVKLRETPEERLARSEGRPAPDRSSRVRSLRDRFGAENARAARGMPRSLSSGMRARLAARMPQSAAEREARLDAADAALAELSRVYVLELPEGQSVELAAEALRADPDVEYAHPNYLAQAHFTPNDPFWSTAGSWNQSEDDLWGLKLLETEQAWDTTQGSGVVVAIVDSGVDFGHADLAANAWVNLGHGSSPPETPGNGIDDDGNGFIDDVNGFDFTRSIDANGDGDYNDPGDTSEAEPIDEHGHGTHVAGTVAAVGNNGIGVIGVAPQVQIMGVRGLDAAGNGTFENLAAALAYAALNGADVINNSWGCGLCPSVPFIEDSIRLAHDLDVVVVFSAGNRNDDAGIRSPQNMSETISVSALTPTDEKTSFSSFGPVVDVGAPGGGVDQPGVVDGVSNVLSLQVPGSTLDGLYPQRVVAPGYFRLAGTSMAAPHASGVAALLRAHDPTLRNEQVRQILRLASDPTVTSGPFLGYGRVNARKVLESTLNAEIFIETPGVEFRLLEDPLAVQGFARGPNLQNVQVSLGAGTDPTSFVAVPTTWNPITGNVDATVDATPFPDGYALLRLQADDGSQSFASSVVVLVDNVQILAPTANEVVADQLDVVIDVGTSPYLERVVVTYFNHFTNQTETLLDTTSIPNPIITIPFDTKGSIDSTELQAVRPTITVQTHFDVDGDVVVTSESVAFQIDNDRITSPLRGTFTTDPSPFSVDGTALHDVQVQVHDGSSWTAVATVSAGPFSVSVDPDALVDLDQQNLVPVRLVADIDGDQLFSDTEQNELVQVFVDTTLSSAWPQRGTEPALGLRVTVGDLDGDGTDELIVVPDGGAFTNIVGGEAVIVDPDPGILVYDGNGVLNAPVEAGSHQYQESGCRTHAALHDMDGLPGMELVWTSWGQIAALRHDGTPPAGFVPDVFNDGVFDFFAHLDPNYTELYPCRPATPYTTAQGDFRILQGTRLFDWNGPKFAGVIPANFLKNKVMLFDATGALINEADRGPGRNNNVHWAVGDVDFDLFTEIVTTRAEVLGPNNEVDATLLVYDAVTLALELEQTLTQTQLLGEPVLVNLDDNADREILITGRQLPPPGQSGPTDYSLFAFNHDGTPVPGFSHTAQQTFTVMAAADVDADNQAEIVLSQRNSNASELVLLDYDPVAQTLSVAPGWPVAIPAGPQAILLADIDGDAALEVIFDSREPWEYSVGNFKSTVFQRYYVTALELDGTPWQGGWERSLRGAPSIAIGNLDGGAPELAVGYAIPTLAEGHPENLLPEALAYTLAGATGPEGLRWSHLFADAQQSGSARVQCQDGIDNDNDGLSDAADPQCTGPLDPVEACGIGPELVVVLPALYWWSRRRLSRRDGADRRSGRTGRRGALHS